MQELNIALGIANLNEYLKSNKIEFEQHSDFTRFEKIASKVRTEPVSGEFSKEKFDLHNENAFWTVGKHQGKPISIHATRYENIGRRNLAEHLQSQQQRVYERPHKIGTKHCPLLYQISGHVCYSGEFQISKEFTVNGYSGVLIMSNFLLTLSKWPHVEWIWGLMNQKLVRAGMASRMGFTHCVPRGVEWKQPPKGVASEDWLVAVSADEVHHWAEIIARYGHEPLLHRQTS